MKPRFPLSSGLARPAFLLLCCLLTLTGLGGVGASNAWAVPMQITYTDNSGEGFKDATLGPARRAALEAVVGNWGRRLGGSVPIEISVSFDPLGPSDATGITLAQASPYGFKRDWSNFFNQLPAPKRSATYYPIALANQQAGKDLDEGHPDMVVACNSDVDTLDAGFYYGLDGNITSGRYDFYSVLYHELGHGLGFTSSFNSNGTFAIENGYANVFDVFLAGSLNGSGEYLTKMTDAQRASIVRGGPVWFAGANATLGGNDASCVIYTPSSYEDGSTLSHLDESTFHGPEETMTPKSSEPVHAPGRRVSGIFRDMGWVVNTTDTILPKVAVTSPADKAVIGSLPAIRGTVSDSGSGVSRVRVSLQAASTGMYWSGAVWVNDSPPPLLSAVVSSGTWSITSNLPASLPQGKYNLSVTAWDQAANSKTITSTFDIADINAPTVTIAAPLEDRGYKTSPLANGTATPNTDYVKLALRNAAGAYWDWTAGGEGAFGDSEFSDPLHAKRIDVPPTDWSFQLPTLPEGDYTFFASGVNTANVGSEYVPRPFHIDATGPQIQVTSPAHNSSVATLTAISGTATDRSGIDANEVKFTLYQDGQYWSGTAWTDTQTTLRAAVEDDGTWTYSNVPTGNNLRVGLYYISANASDTINNLSTPTSGENQTSFRVDKTPPTCTITSPANNSSVTGITVITGTADDNAGIDRVSLYILRLSDNAFWDGTAFAGGGSAILPVNYDATTKTWQSAGRLPGTNKDDPSRNWSNGDYDIIAIAYDEAGNEKRADAIVTYRYMYTWTGATMRDSDPNNDSDRWDTVDNWIPLGIPGADDEAVIANGDTVQAGGDHSVKSLTIVNSKLNTTSLTIKNLDLNGTLNGGTVNSNGGVWNWTGGAISGTWNVLSGGTLNFANAQDVSLADGMTLTNTGTINWIGPGKVFCNGYTTAATINNNSGGVINFTRDGTPFTTSSRATLNNAQGAKIVKTGGDGLTTFSGWTLVSSGELGSNVGTLSYNAPLYFNHQNSITGLGKHELTGGTLEISGTSTAIGSVFTISGGQVTGVGTAATLATASGGSWNWNGGTFAYTIANTGTFNIGGTATKTFSDNAAFNNTGTVTWTGGDIFSNGYTIPAKFNNKGPGTFTATSGNKFITIPSGGGGVFNNGAGATFNRTGNAITQSDWVFNNDGLVNSAQGTLLLNAGGTGTGQFNTGAGAFVKFNAGNYALTGPRFTGTGKTQLLGGQVTVTGNLTLGNATSPSTFEVSGGSLLGTVIYVNGVAKSSTVIASGHTTPSSLNWTGGVMGGTQTWAASLKTDISDPTTGKTNKTIADAAIINNDGAVTWRGVGQIVCSGYLVDPIFNNRRGATFTFANGGTPFFASEDGTFNNLLGATLIKNGTANLTLKSWTYTNAGTLTTNTGTTEFTSTLTLAAGTQIKGVGTTRFAGTVNANTPFAAAGPVRLDAGSFNGGPLTAFTGKSFTWTGGSIGGQFTLTPGSILTTSGPLPKPLGNTVFNNYGAVTWSGPGAIDGGGATFNNRRGATLTFLTGGTPFSGGAGFNNQIGARLVKSGTGTLTLTKWDFNNESEISTANGVTQFLSTLNAKAGTRFTGAGTTRFAGTVNLSAPFSSVGPVRLDAGALNGSPTASFTGPSFTWTGGAINTQFTLNAGSVMSVSGSTAKGFADATVFNNKGTVKWQGGASIHNGGYIAGATFNNMNGATFEAAVDGIPFSTDYGSTFNNQANAKFVKSAGAGKTTFSKWAFNNGSWNGTALLLGGTVEAKTGLIDFATTLNLRGGVFKGAGQTIWSGSAITIGAPITIDNTKLTWSAGTLSGTSSGTKGSAAISTLGTGNFNWTGGHFTGKMLLMPKSITNISGSATKSFADYCDFSNAGTITWSGGNLASGGYLAPATLNNLAGATFNVRGTGKFISPHGSNLNNAGLFDLGTTTLQTDGWNYAQSSTGTTSLNIASASLYGKLITLQNASLAGNLNALVAPGYVPVTGTTFKVLAHKSRAGTFARVNVTGNTTRLYTAKYNPSDVSLVVSAKTASPLRSEASALAPEETPAPAAIPEESPDLAPDPTPMPLPSASVSTASLNVSASSLVLNFVQGLDATSATDLTHYSVTINGQAVELAGVAIKANSVTLFLPEGALHATDSVTVEWNGLKSRGGSPFAPGVWNNGINPT